MAFCQFKCQIHQTTLKMQLFSLTGSIKNTGRVFTKEHNKKISESKKGTKLSDKHKQRLSFLNKGQKNKM